ncbi:MAG: 50S ribosomal protein L23 [Parcubacteria group bacterium GW2011_GWA2_36_10]|nr:MAG: 50S ribosomal protein L23 [Parcubacteria group bacterium GW2011_GWA2_36_10]
MGIFKKKEETPVAAVAKTTDEAVLKTDKVVSPKTASILLRPVISEKATFANSLNQYVFAVNNKANKVEIKKAIKAVYGVMPQAVNVINELGKNVRVGRRFGKRKNTKKAIVTLKKGDSITIYEGI